MAFPPIYIGIDVAKDRLDAAALPSGESWRVANDPDGIDALVLRLTDLHANLIVMEGTDGHEHAVAAALAAAGLAVAVVNPRQVRDFAPSKRARCGGRRRTSCGACPASGACRRRRSWPTSPSWVS